MDNPYVIPGAGVLRNRFGVTDPVQLHQCEFEATFTHQVELEARRLPGSYDLDHLRAFHQHLFQDVYDWAGEIRTVDMSKHRSLFALARFIIEAATESSNVCANGTTLPRAAHAASMASVLSNRRDRRCCAERCAGTSRTSNPPAASAIET